MTPNENAQTIIEWFADFDISKGDIDGLLTNRQHLSINCTKIANYVKDQESKYKKIYMERKIAEATTVIMEEGTGVYKGAKSIVDNKELRVQEAEFEGNAKGAKIVLDSYYKVLDAMASMINVMRTI